MNFNLRIGWVWAAAWLSLGLVQPALATLILPDQLGVGGGGLGSVVASHEAILQEVGYPVDDSFEGEITFQWRMQWRALEGGTAQHSWSMLQFFADPGDGPVDLSHERAGIGTDWESARISTSKEPGGYALGRESGTVIRLGEVYDFTLVVTYHAGAQDTAVLTGGGFIDQPLTPGDWAFNHLRVRAGSDGKQETRVDFTHMTITSRGIGGIERVQPVDPAFPAATKAPTDGAPADASVWPWVQIRRLRVERDRLLRAISVLPQHKPVLATSELGFHSAFAEVGAGAAVAPHVMDFHLARVPTLHSIALAPAFNPKTKGAYAFPKRFKIEVLENRNGQLEEVVNWMDQDFPDPGPYPVYFSAIDQATRLVRMTVIPEVQESGVAYFALGEVFLFRHAPNGQIGDNMAAWGAPGIEVAASDPFVMPPLWDLSYLSDGSTGFGLPLSDQRVASDDLVIVYDEPPTSDEITLVFDLGQNQAVGRVDFWPAGAPYLLALPSFGFPQEIFIELSTEADFSVVSSHRVASGHLLRGGILSVMTEGVTARFLRFTMRGLSEYKGRKIFGMGEISVSEFGEVLSANCKVTAQGIPDRDRAQLNRLVDGCCQQRLILSEGEWIRGLAKRKPLDQRLAMVEAELAQTTTDWQRLKLHSATWGGAGMIALLIGGLGVQRQVRRRGLARLKARITRDLHDEVGSSLGSISLTAEHLEALTNDLQMKAELDELSLMAREACVSLREVIWVTDQQQVSLASLVKRLIERAERVLGRVQLEVSQPERFPELVVSFSFKRHLVMLFKEALHNCVRHAEARRVWIDFAVSSERFSLSVRDDGCGFDPAAISEGCGMDHLRDRAIEMGGELCVQSKVGSGTEISLVVPLAMLNIEPSTPYVTSN